METLQYILDLVLHLDAHLISLVESYGAWAYVILFLIIFAETGLVVTPFFPGDTLLFGAGAIASTGVLSIYILVPLFLTAAILGDTVNYFVGRYAGERLLEKYPKLIKPAHLERTRRFFERYGGSAVVICRFVPVVRTIVPFLAGAGSMHYERFLRYNIAGALLWVFLTVPTGYFFAQVPFVKDHFALVLILITLTSFIPALYEVVRAKYFPRKP